MRCRNSAKILCPIIGSLSPRIALRRPEQFAADAGEGVPGVVRSVAATKRIPPPPWQPTAGTAGSDDAAWQVRVVQNKYPALEMVERPLTINSALYEVGPGFGVHEVIVEAPDHVLSFGGLDERQAELVFLAYRDRLLQLRANPRIAYGQLFKNSGSAAGASLEHTHSQLIGTPIIPTQIQAELARSRSYFERHGRCVFCAMIQEELSAGARVVFESEAFLAFCPYASQFPYEIWIVPKRHACSFESAEDGEIRDLARTRGGW